MSSSELFDKVRNAAGPPLLVEVGGGIARLTLNRPEAGNAIDLAMAKALVAAAIRCENDATVRCVVLTGAGRLFCAGGDLGAITSAGAARPFVLDELAGTLHMAVARLARLSKPLLVLVNGSAAGAGFGLALLGDIVICSKRAHFTSAYTRIGLTPDGGLSWLLPKLAGLRRAQDIILTNRRIDAYEAETIGLVTRVVPAEALADEGEAIAGQLLGAATGAIAAAKALLREGATASLETQLEREAQSIARAGGTPEAEEGLAALRAGRDPDFRGASAAG